jgi:transposase InsO family protein
VGRFEREACDELWQADFKGLGERPPPYRVLSVVDDRSRFLVALRVVPRATDEEVWEAFWSVFAERGLPQALLTDNEGCFHSRSSKGPSFLEARLWRLGIDTCHGRPGHPQTQGKVERFHRTMERELGASMRPPEPKAAQEALDSYREDYNWSRPHEAVGMKPPGVVYVPAGKARPERLPEAVHPEGSEVRKVDSCGRFVRKGVRYQPGRGLAGEAVALVEKDEGLVCVYAGKVFAKLEELRV